VTQFLQFLADSLSAGSTYVLLGLGLSLVFSVMGLINFAYGTLIVWAGYAIVELDGWGLPYPLTIALMCLFVAVLSVLMGQIAFRPFLRAPPSTLLLTSFGVALASQAIVIYVFGESPRSVPLPSWVGNSVTHGAVHINVLQLITIGVAALVLVLLLVVLRRTTLGLYIRAAAEDEATSRLVGIPASSVLTAVFAISGLISGVVAFLWLAKVGTIDPRADLTPTLKAFIVVVLGGIGTIEGAVIGGLLLGLFEAGTATYLPTALISYQQSIAFALVTAVLLFRPQGLVGRHLLVSK
jgi:branched-chain amino acid transport system permease protein